jgi:hypothetical protein
MAGSACQWSGGADDDDVEVLVVEDGAVVVDAFGPFLRRLLRLGDATLADAFIDVADVAYLDVRLGGERAQQGVALPAHADAGDAEPLAGGDGAAGQREAGACCGGVFEEAAAGGVRHGGLLRSASRGWGVRPQCRRAPPPLQRKTGPQTESVQGVPACPRGGLLPGGPEPEVIRLQRAYALESDPPNVAGFLMTDKKDELPSPSAVSEVYTSLTKGIPNAVLRLSQVSVSGHGFIRAELLTQDGSSATELYFPSEGAGTRPLPPELRQWALSQHTEEEIAAALHDLRGKGGPELGELIHELEQGTGA